MKGLLKVNPKVREVQVKRLAQLRSSRDSKRTEASLKELKKVAQGDGNLMGPILDCVRAYCTLGETCDVLRGVFGEYEPIVTVYFFWDADERRLSGFIHDDISLMHFVIPGLTRNPVLSWIPAFAGMTRSVVINDAVYNKYKILFCEYRRKSAS